MNSSTSISDKGWRRFWMRYAAWVLGIGIVLGTVMLGLDPYDTGRFALFGSYGVPQFGQRLADASLGRQAQFDIAILGNSTMQLIDPSRFGDGGHRAVSLTMPGTGPREQLSVADWFLRHHKGTAKALIVGLDQRWCESNHPPDLIHPFPFWLYGDISDYLVHMIQYKSFESAARKLGLLLGVVPAMRADGYNDYDTGHAWDRAGFRERLNAPTEEGEAEFGSVPPYHFAAAPLLRDFLLRLPRGVAVVLVVPPQFLPGMDSNSVRQQAACADTFRDLASRRAHTRFINFLAHDDLTSREDDYWERSHYRSRVAREMESEIDEVLAQL